MKTHKETAELRSLLAIFIPFRNGKPFFSFPSEFHPVPAESWAEAGKRAGGDLS